MSANLQMELHMKITRIQVEEGFLDGLDLSFNTGLNVLIGPRGSGKTSVIELIRYCLGVPNYNQEFEKAARRQALDILGSGRVTVTVNVDGVEEQFSRTSNMPSRFSIATKERPIILSQGEIEKVGDNEMSKRVLLDEIGTPGLSKSEDLFNDTSMLISLTKEAKNLIDERQSLNDEIESLVESIRFDKDQSPVDAVATSNDVMMTLLSRVDTLSKEVSIFLAKERLYKRAAESIVKWHGELNAVIDHVPSFENWSDDIGKVDDLADMRSIFQRVIERLGELASETWKAAISTEFVRTEASNHRAEVEQKLRELRSELEQMQAGQGAAARRMSQMREREGKLEELHRLVQEKSKRIESLRHRRHDEVSKLLEKRSNRFMRRERTASMLNKALGPSIRVCVDRDASYSDYEETIVAMLKGSGMHYSTLGQQLATKVGPIEFAEACENDDIVFLSDTCAIDRDRAAKIARLAREYGVEHLITARVEDNVRFILHTGRDTQPTEKLSTGQRCTVVLPILLSDQYRTLVIDQPEDNLDNGFIVDTVIKSLHARAATGQLICSTHNPNIVVLGDAQRVIVLNSDGLRGFVRSAAHLEHPDSVAAITTIMEGGREAFELRSQFYGRSINSNG
jgi:ABC-type lipoprotein export system ATPase subunit